MACQARHSCPASGPARETGGPFPRGPAAAGRTLPEHLDAVVADALAPRSLVEAAAATYLAHYRAHLAAEEQEVIPRAAELLTAQDWADVAAAVPAQTDPLFGDDIEARYRKLRRQIALEAMPS